MIRVVIPGMRTLVEDLGRPGVAGLGVSPSGAADQGALRLANRLLGNDEGAAGLEALLGGVVLEAVEPTRIAVTGAPVPVTVAGRAVPMATAVHVPAGALVELGRGTTGLRTYLAVLGGIDIAPVLGSRSSDTIAGIGHAPLAVGDELPSGGLVTAADAVTALTVGPGAADTAAAFYRGPSGDIGSGIATLTATWGPRADWFTPEARAAFTRTTWVVGPDSDRVGVRCTGATLTRSVEGELASEAVVRGSVQVPSSGQPVMFLADHPTTGGYPVIAVLDPAAVDLLAQQRPGDRMRVQVRPIGYETDLRL